MSERCGNEFRADGDVLHCKKDKGHIDFHENGYWQWWDENPVIAGIQQGRQAVREGRTVPIEELRGQPTEPPASEPPVDTESPAVLKAMNRYYQRRVELLSDELRQAVASQDGLPERLLDLQAHVKKLPEYYEWMKGPGSCYPGPKQSLILRHQVLDWLEAALAELVLWLYGLRS